MPIPDEPITRREMFYDAIAGGETIPPDPISREEMYLWEIAQNGGDGGGGGVTSFNGRNGIVWPQIGDYTAEQIGTSTDGKSVQDILDEETSERKIADESLREKIVNPDWNATTGTAQILNKPTTLAGYGISDAYTKLQGLDSSVTTKFLTIRVATIVDQINVELHTVNLTNTDSYPFNNSAVTVALDERRNNLDYSVETEVLSRTGGVESVEIYDKQLNGFKVKFNGSGSAATVRLKITGGIT
jgi:hypothetical protein